MIVLRVIQLCLRLVRMVLVGMRVSRVCCLSRDSTLSEYLNDKLFFKIFWFHRFVISELKLYYENTYKTRNRLVGVGCSQCCL